MEHHQKKKKKNGGAEENASFEASETLKRIELNDEQRRARQKIMENDITMLIGNAGTGKTFIATFVALELYLNKEAHRIIVTRPTVSREKIGYLPGDIAEKLDPWLMPIYNNMHDIAGRTFVEKMIKDRNLQIVPLAFMRGLTFVNSVCIVDEAQNATIEQMLMIFTRIGKKSKIIATGDLKQVDLIDKKDSGLSFFSKMKNDDGIAVVNMESNHRLPIVENVLNFYETNK